MESRYGCFSVARSMLAPHRMEIICGCAQKGFARNSKIEFRESPDFFLVKRFTKIAVMRKMIFKNGFKKLLPGV